MNGQEEFNYPGFGVDDVGHFLLRVRRQIAEPINDDPNGKWINNPDHLEYFPTKKFKNLLYCYLEIKQDRI